MRAAYYMTAVALIAGLAHAECRPKPIAELQYMSRVELESEVCMTALTIKLNRESMARAKASGDRYDALAALEDGDSALACLDYGSTVLRVLSKDHKVDGQSAFDKGISGGLAPCGAEFRAKWQAAQDVKKAAPK